jgi:hypothetical protein
LVIEWISELDRAGQPERSISGRITGRGKGRWASRGERSWRRVEAGEAIETELPVRYLA